MISENKIAEETSGNEIYSKNNQVHTSHKDIMMNNTSSKRETENVIDAKKSVQEIVNEVIMNNAQKIQLTQNRNLNPQAQQHKREGSLESVQLDAPPIQESNMTENKTNTAEGTARDSRNTASAINTSATESTTTSSSSTNISTSSSHNSKRTIDVNTGGNAEITTIESDSQLNQNTDENTKEFQFKVLKTYIQSDNLAPSSGTLQNGVPQMNSDVSTTSPNSIQFGRNEIDHKSFQLGLKIGFRHRDINEDQLLDRFSKLLDSSDSNTSNRGDNDPDDNLFQRRSQNNISSISSRMSNDTSFFKTKNARQPSPEKYIATFLYDPSPPVYNATLNFEDLYVNPVNRRIMNVKHPIQSRSKRLQRSNKNLRSTLSSSSKTRNFNQSMKQQSHSESIDSLDDSKQKLYRDPYWNKFYLLHSSHAQREHKLSTNHLPTLYRKIDRSALSNSFKNTFVESDNRNENGQVTKMTGRRENIGETNTEVKSVSSTISTIDNPVSENRNLTGQFEAEDNLELFHPKESIQTRIQENVPSIPKKDRKFTLVKQIYGQPMREKNKYENIASRYKMAKRLPPSPKEFYEQHIHEKTFLPIDKKIKENRQKSPKKVYRKRKRKRKVHNLKNEDVQSPNANNSNHNVNSDESNVENMEEDKREKNPSSVLLLHSQEESGRNWSDFELSPHSQRELVSTGTALQEQISPPSPLSFSSSSNSSTSKSANYIPNKMQALHTDEVLTPRSRALRLWHDENEIAQESSATTNENRYSSQRNVINIPRNKKSTQNVDTPQKKQTQKADYKKKTVLGQSTKLTINNKESKRSPTKRKVGDQQNNRVQTAKSGTRKQKAVIRIQSASGSHVLRRKVDLLNHMDESQSSSTSVNPEAIYSFSIIGSPNMLNSTNQEHFDTESHITSSGIDFNQFLSSSIISSAPVYQ